MSTFLWHIPHINQRWREPIINPQTNIPYKLSCLLNCDTSPLGVGILLSYLNNQQNVDSANYRDINTLYNSRKDLHHIAFFLVRSVEFVWALRSRFRLLKSTLLPISKFCPTYLRGRFMRRYRLRSDQKNSTINTATQHQSPHRVTRRPFVTRDMSALKHISWDFLFNKINIVKSFVTGGQ